MVESNTGKQRKNINKPMDQLDEYKLLVRHYEEFMKRYYTFAQITIMIITIMITFFSYAAFYYGITLSRAILIIASITFLWVFVGICLVLVSAAYLIETWYKILKLERMFGISIVESEIFLIKGVFKKDIEVEDVLNKDLEQLLSKSALIAYRLSKRYGSYWFIVAITSMTVGLLSIVYYLHISLS